MSALSRLNISIFRRGAVVCLVAFLLFAALPGHAQSMVMMGFEEAAVNRKWADNRFFARMEEKTGLAFTFDQYTDEALYRQAVSVLSPGDPDMPDLLFKASLSPAETIDLLANGAIINLAPYLETHCPNLTALLAENPALRQAITLPDGQIGALPFVEAAPAQNVLWINRNWLDTLKLDMPTDAKSLEAALLAFKTLDPNRNGRNDEVPLSFMGPYDLKYLAHAFGLTANDYNLFVESSSLRFMPLEDGFRDFVSWCRGLHAQGLLAKDGFATLDSFRRVSDAKAINRLGAFFSPLPTYLVPMEWAGEYEALPPLVFEGRQVYRAIAQPWQTGTFAITSVCQDVAAALQWVDCLYSPEGAVLAAIGLEGQDYVVDGDGSWRSLPGIHDPQYQANGIIATGSTAPGVSSDAFQRRYTDPMVRKLSEQVDGVARIAAVPFPPFSLSREEQAEVAPLQAALGRHVDETIARFVLGEREITDEAFDEFQRELEALGLSEFMAFWQKAYDRGEDLAQ